MNDLERYLDRVIGQKAVDSEAPQIPVEIPMSPENAPAD